MLYFLCQSLHSPLNIRPNIPTLDEFILEDIPIVTLPLEKVDTLTPKKKEKKLILTILSFFFSLVGLYDWHPESLGLTRLTTCYSIILTQHNEPMLLVQPTSQCFIILLRAAPPHINVYGPHTHMLASHVSLNREAYGHIFVDL